MKIKFLLAFFLLAMPTFLSAQHKPIDHHFYAGFGLSLNHDKWHKDMVYGTSIKIGYGINFRLSQRCSFMPGLAYREILDRPFGEERIGSDEDAFSFIDMPLIFRYALTDPTRAHWVIGIGPVLSYCINNDTYYVDAIPNSPWSEHNELKPFTIGLQPSIGYQWKHWNVGIEAFVAPFNMGDGHGLGNVDHRIHSIEASVGYRF